MLHGFLNVCKPRGLTSHDVVARVRALVGQRRVGHAGTLDPMAEGVLPVALGRATRLADRIGEGEKVYHSRLHLGVVTSTDDAEGDVVATVAVPPLTEEHIIGVLRCFQGEIEQVPPAYSAIRVGGKRSYALARRGQAVELAPRRVSIYDLALLGWRPPTATVLVRCSRGTYVRALARDIGQALGCGGHLSALTRVSVGAFHLSWALGLEELASRRQADELASAVVAADFAVLDLPALVVDEGREADFRHGRSWHAQPLVAAPRDGQARAYTTEGRLLGLMHYDSSDGRWHPRLALFD